MKRLILVEIDCEDDKLCHGCVMECNHSYCPIPGWDNGISIFNVATRPKECLEAEKKAKELISKTRLNP